MNTDPLRVVFLAFDIEEVSQIRAIRAIRGAGAQVVSLSFRRGNMNAGFRPEWKDVPLGTSANGTGLARLWSLLRGAVRLVSARHLTGDADVLIARNLDMALLALLLRALTRRRTPVVYQCLDIHSLLTSSGFRGGVARWAERRVLARSSLLVVSAPAFITRYFGPLQGYAGPAHLLENRIVWHGPVPARPALPPPRAGPLRLGWVGTLRCPRTLSLLGRVAEEMGPAVEIVLHGAVHHHHLPDFDEILSRHTNLSYVGPYAYPEGLATVYAGLDCVWAQDLWQGGGNSDWLLPNRLYEAGYHGCPAIAIAGTETARWIAEHRSGCVIDHSGPVALISLLRRGRTPLSQITARLHAGPEAPFVQSPAEVRAMLSAAMRPPGTTGEGPRCRSRSQPDTATTGQPS